MKIRIGDWTVVPTLNLLERGNESLKLEPRAMDLLVYLAKARDRVVSADELLREVWRGRVFDDGLVYSKINQLRKALGDDPRSPRFITTIPKRGYRFIAEVAEEELERVSIDAAVARAPEASISAAAAAAKRFAPRARAIVATLVVLAAGAGVGVGYFARADRAPADFAIAVLPCENLSPNADRAYFASGIQEAIIDQLAALGFRVVGRSAVLPFAAKTEPLTEIARSLSVDALIECSVRYADDQVRIAVALSDGASGEMLWRRPYEGVFANYFAIESEIASSVTDALGATVTPGRRAALDKVASRSGRAIEFYFSARRYEELGVTNWPTAASQYERAVAEDSGFARAFAQLSLLRTSLYLSVAPVPENLDKARAAAEDALRLEPDLPQARVAMLAYQFHSRTETVAVIAEKLAAVAQDAQGVSEFFQLRGAVQRRLGRPEDALADAAKAVELGAPRDVPLLVINALAHQQLRQYKEAAELLDRIAEIAPDDWGTKCHRATLSLQSAGDTRALRAMEDRVPVCGGATAALIDGDYDVAMRVIETSPLPVDDPRRQSETGIILRAAGNADAAWPLLENSRKAFTLRLANVPLEAQPPLKLTLARLSAYLGEAETARRYADEALASVDSVPPGDVPNLRLTAAAVYAVIGDSDRAIAELDHYLAGAGQWSIEGIARSPDFAPLLQDTRFAALREQYKPRSMPVPHG